MLFVCVAVDYTKTTGLILVKLGGGVGEGGTQGMFSHFAENCSHTCTEIFRRVRAQISESDAMEIFRNLSWKCLGNVQVSPCEDTDGAFASEGTC